MTRQFSQFTPRDGVEVSETEKATNDGAAFISGVAVSVGVFLAIAACGKWFNRGGRGI